MNKSKTKKKLMVERRGFTLIEMTIVLFIISLLILIIIPNLSNQRKHAQGIHSNAMVSVVQSQVDAYYSEFPKAKHVTLAELHNKGYLTNKQLKEANDDGIKIKDSQAVK